MIGGTTYEESKEINRLSKKLNINIILGGNTIHNSKTFLAEVG